MYNILVKKWNGSNWISIPELTIPDDMLKNINISNGVFIVGISFSDNVIYIIDNYDENVNTFILGRVVI